MASEHEERTEQGRLGMGYTYTEADYQRSKACAIISDADLAQLVADVREETLAEMEEIGARPGWGTSIREAARRVRWMRAGRPECSECGYAHEPSTCGGYP